MSALCAGRRLCSAALWSRAPPAARARNLQTRRLRGQLQHRVSLCSASQEGHGPEGQREAPQPTRPPGIRTWRRRPLSPLDRLSSIIPPEFITQEVRDLQSPEQLSTAGTPSPCQDPPEPLRPPSSCQEPLRPPSPCQDPPEPLRPPSSCQDPPEPLRPLSPYQDPPEPLRPPSFFQDPPELLRPPSSCPESGPHGISEHLPPPEPPTSHHEQLCCPPKSSPPRDPAPFPGVPFQSGDLLLAEYKRRHYSMFRKMFVLKDSGKLVSNWGAISYKDLLGRLSGEKVRTSTGHHVFLRRPSLDEYVLYMKRGPTISYPKDIAAILMMMDVSPGDVILEAGSGSGALSLFLSRAVGPAGCVHSVELRSDHHLVSKRNFLRWKTAWEIRSRRSWPDNVNFINKDIRDAMSALGSVGFDAVALDMLSPQVALPAIIGNLKQGGVCAVYITNITQVIDLLEGIRSCELPLLCEKVLEVSITDWLVAPSLRKDGSVSKRVDPQENPSSETQTPEQGEDDDDDSQSDDDDFVSTSPPFGQVPYIARPMPWQVGHTAFLVKLRKCNAAAEPGDST